MTSLYTKAELASRIGELVGNSAITSTIEIWIDLVLRQLAGAYRLPELEKQHSGTLADGTATLAWPSDYGFLVIDPTKQSVGKLTDSAGTISPIYPAAFGDAVNDTARTSDGKGTPQFVADDHQNSRWLVHPISNIAGTLTLNYQSQPAVTASGVAVWFPDDLALIQAVVPIGERYMRGGLVDLDTQIGLAARSLYLRSPRRAQLWANQGIGAGLSRRFFK